MIFKAIITYDGTVTEVIYGDEAGIPYESLDIPASSLPHEVTLGVEYRREYQTWSATFPSIVEEGSDYVIFQFTGGWHDDLPPPDKLAYIEVLAAGQSAGAPVLIPIPPGYEIEIISATGPGRLDPYQKYTLDYQGTTVERNGGEPHTVPPSTEGYMLTVTGYHRPNDTAGWVMSRGRLTWPNEYTWQVQFDDGMDADYGDLVVTGVMIPAGQPVHIPIPPECEIEITSEVGAGQPEPYQKYTLEYQGTTVERNVGEPYTVPMSMEEYVLTVTGYHRANDTAEWMMSKGRLTWLSEYTWQAQFANGTDYTDLVVTGKMIPVDLSAYLEWAPIPKLVTNREKFG